jgi:hypothetical protein
MPSPRLITPRTDPINAFIKSIRPIQTLLHASTHAHIPIPATLSHYSYLTLMTFFIFNFVCGRERLRVPLSPPSVGLRLSSMHLYTQFLIRFFNPSASSTNIHHRRRILPSAYIPSHPSISVASCIAFCFWVSLVLLVLTLGFGFALSNRNL